MNSNELTDVEAVSRLRQGDEEALCLLYWRYLDRVFRLALNLTGRPEEAEEVVEDAFFQVFRFARDYRQEGSFAAWLFRITRNLCLTRLRRGKWLQLLPIEQLTEHNWDTEVPADTLLRLSVQEGLNKLPLDYRSILIMRDLEGLTNKEAAQVIGRSPAATKSLHFRARQALRDALLGVLEMKEE